MSMKQIIGIIFLSLGVFTVSNGAILFYLNGVLPELKNQMDCSGLTPDWFCEKGGILVDSAKNQLHGVALMSVGAGLVSSIIGITILRLTRED